MNEDDNPEIIIMTDDFLHEGVFVSPKNIDDDMLVKGVMRMNEAHATMVDMDAVSGDAALKFMLDSDLISLGRYSEVLQRIETIKKRDEDNN